MRLGFSLLEHVIKIIGLVTVARVVGGTDYGGVVSPRLRAIVFRTVGNRKVEGLHSSSSDRAGGSGFS